jgi:AraC-like DNA-binding protein
MPETRQSDHGQDAAGWHTHDSPRLVYPSSGVLSISAAGGTWVVPPQRAAWIPAGIPHAHRTHGRVRMRTLAFPAAESAARSEEEARTPQAPIVVAVSPLLREVIVALTSDDSNTDDSNTDDSNTDDSNTGESNRTASQRANLLTVALDELHRVDELPVRLPAVTDGRLQAIAGMLRANPADERTLADFCREVGSSERTLSRLFRDEAGMSFPQWRTRFRLLRALVLLADGTPVTSTALACGWSSPSAFIDTFRRAFGATPGRFYTPLTDHPERFRVKRTRYGISSRSAPPPGPALSISCT